MAVSKQNSGSGETTGDSKDPRRRCFVFGEFELRAGSCELLRSGRPTDLQLKPTRLLLYLVDNRDRVVPKTELLNAIWADTHVSESAFNTGISEIRRVLRDDGDTQRYLRTRRGRGYQFVAEVEEHPGPGASQDSSNRVSVTDSAPRSRGPNHVRLRRAALVATALILTLAAMTWWSGSDRAARTARALSFEARDWVLITAFENGSGEALLDGSLEAALARELSISPHVNVVPRSRVDDVLPLLGKPLDTRVDMTLGLEICQRDGAIRALVAGEVDAVDSGYAVTLRVVDPRAKGASQRIIERAATREELGNAMHRLASRIHSLLRPDDILGSRNGSLVRPPIPSLRALQLYAEADAVIARPGGNAPAEELLRQAVLEDPEFASAYNLLGYVVANQLRQREEYMPHAEQAFALLDNAVESEQYFIRASYHGFRGELEKELAQYEALLRLYPDHPWGNNNLTGALWASERWDAAAESVVRTADLFPYDFTRNVGAAQTLARLGRFDEAEIYIARAERIAQARDVSLAPRDLAWLRLYPAHRAWLQGDLERSLEIVRRWDRKLDSENGAVQAQLSFFIAASYHSLGITTELLWRFEGSEGYRLRQGIDALLRGDRDGVREYLDPNAGGRAYRFHSLLGWARAGIPDTARLLDEFEADLELLPHGAARVWQRRIQMVRGELAAIEGRPQEAVWLIQGGLAWAKVLPGVYFGGSQSLAKAWDDLAGCGESDWVGRDASDGRRAEQGEGSPFPVRTGSVSHG